MTLDSNTVNKVRLGEEVGVSRGWCKPNYDCWWLGVVVFDLVSDYALIDYVISVQTLTLGSILRRLKSLTAVECVTVNNDKNPMLL